MDLSPTRSALAPAQAPRFLPAGAPLDAFTVVGRKVDELGEGDRGWIPHGLGGVAKTGLLNELLA
jgi:hypothetical protein